MKSLIIVFCALLLIIGIPFVFDSVDDAITDELTANYASVTTGAGVTSANSTLASELFNKNVANVSGVSSNVTGDTPSAYSYNGTSQQLLVSGLLESQTRTLTVEYLTEKTDSWIIILTLIRWFYIFVIVGTIVGAIYAFFD